MVFLSEAYKRKLMQLAGLPVVEEAIEFNRDDLTKAYSKSAQRIQGFDVKLIEQAIREGRAIGISYKSKDMPVTKFRVVLPVTIGTYKTKSDVKHKLSAFHLAGQSERVAQNAEKEYKAGRSDNKNYRSTEPEGVWRLFDLDTKSFKGMWLTDKFFYEYPKDYKRKDKRFSHVDLDYDVNVAIFERDARESRGEELGEPIDLTNVKSTGQSPAEAPENKEEPETNAVAPEIEAPITEKKQLNIGDEKWWLEKPWNKYLKNGFKF